VTSPHLSVVIPVRNESASIPELYRQLTATLERWGRTYEILVIDDGSTDDSFERLAAIQAGDRGSGSSGSGGTSGRPRPSLPGSPTREAR